MPHTLTDAQVAELLADETIPVAHRALWALLWEGELRLGDVLSLDVCDVDLAERTARVDYLKRGTGPATVPIGETAAALLHRAIDDTEGPAIQIAGRPISREAASLRARSTGAGSIHAFRRSGQISRGTLQPKE